MSFKFTHNESEKYLAYAGPFELNNYNHRYIINELSITAKRNKMEFAAIVFTETEASDQSAMPTALELSKLGADTVIILNLTEINAETHFYDVIDEARKVIQISALFTFMNQTCGSSITANSEAVRDYCKKTRLGLYFVNNQILN